MKAIPNPSGRESSESCTFLIHTDTSADPFKIFSKYTPARPLSTHALRAALNPISFDCSRSDCKV